MWLDKNFHSLNYEMKKNFNEKIIKLSINGGFTCPNRDGTISSKGCIFCSEEGSGDFAGCVDKSIYDQLEQQVSLLSDKWATAKYIAYFQSYTNTYDDINVLKSKYDEALSFAGVKGLAIATRPDALSDEVIELLKSYNEKTFLWIELGLQTIHDDTAKIIRRGYDLNTFDSVYDKLIKAGIKVVIHSIIGLPGEDYNKIIATANYIAKKKPWGVKIHLLHILKNTDLYEYYQKTHFHLYTYEEYINVVVDILEILPEDITIHRMTGDAPKDLLFEPWWSLDKRRVLNGIDKELKRRASYQGKKHMQKEH